MTRKTPQVSEIAPDGTAYEFTGPKDAPCVVLIHGLGLSRRLWDQHIGAFAGFRVLRYDLYGHGDSGPAPGEGALTLYARQIAGLLDCVGVGQAHLVGFSIGGMINRRFAMDYPGRVLSLCILNSPHDRGAEAQAAVEARAIAAQQQGAFATFEAALQRWFTPDYLTSGAGPALVRDWRGQVDDASYAQTAWVLAHGVRELTGLTMDVPALVMTCENDTGSTPQMSREIAAGIAGAKVVMVPRLQHLGLMQDPGAFTAPVVRFLEALSGQQT